MAEQHMQIGEVANQTGLSLRTIRYYEEMGLVVPSARTTGGFRLYTESDVDRLQLIKRMKPLEFSLEETKDLLSALDELESATGGSTRAALIERLEKYHEAAKARVAAVRDQLVIADDFAADLNREIKRQKSTGAA